MMPSSTAGSQTEPTVSVVVPTHNRPGLLTQTLASLRAQTRVPTQVIVVDDASTPAVQLSASDSAGLHIELIRSETAHGGAAAKARGANASRGDIICFVDDDDVLAPTFVERAVEVLQSQPDIDVLFVEVDWFGAGADYACRTHNDSMRRLLEEAGPLQRADGVLVFDDGLLRGLLRRVPMAFQRPVARRAAFQSVGNFRAECLLWDCDWALRAAMSVRCALLLDRLYRQRVDGQGYSSRGDREIEHLRSASEMTLRLHKHAGSGLQPDRREVLKRGAGLNAGRLAYAAAQRGDVREAVIAWLLTLRLAPSATSWKVPLAAMYRYVRRG